MSAEPAAFVPGPWQAIRVAASRVDGLMDLADEGGWASMDGADPARFTQPGARIVQLAGTDAGLVFVVCHADTIGSLKPANKGEKFIVVA